MPSIVPLAATVCLLTLYIQSSDVRGQSANPKTKLILLVAALFYGVYLLARGKHSLRPRALSLSAATWLFCAVCEYIIVLVSPEANTRVDLLVIVPVVTVLTIVGVMRSFLETWWSISQFAATTGMLPLAPGH